MYDEGISKTGELIDLGVKANIVEKSGSWYTYDSQRIGQGRENAKGFLRDNPQAAQALEREIRANAGLIATRILEGPEAVTARMTAIRKGPELRLKPLPPAKAAARPGSALANTAASFAQVARSMVASTNCACQRGCYLQNCGNRVSVSGP